MKWVELKPGKGDKINEQAIKILSDSANTCVVMFAIRKNKDGSSSPVFLLSRNFKDPGFFVTDLMKLLEEHSKFNLVKTDKNNSVT